MTDRASIIGEWVDSAYQKWAYNYLRNNLWRVAHVKGDMDDMMQEAAIEFILMKRDYEDKVNSPQQFMSLYKLCLMSHINNISSKDSRNRHALTQLEVIEPAVSPDANITILLNEGSPELKEVLSIFFNAPQEVMNILRKEASSFSPKQFWNRVLTFCNISQERSAALAKELNDLLS